MSGKSYKKQWQDPDEILEILFSSRLDELGDLEESIDVGNHEDNDSDEYDDDDDYEEKESEPSSETLQIKTTEEKQAPDAELVLTPSQSELNPARSDVVDFRKQKQNENFSLDGTLDIAMDSDNDLPGFSGGAGYLDPVVSSNTENIFYDSDHDSLNNEPVNPETDAVL